MGTYVVKFDLYNGMYTEHNVNCIVQCNSTNEAMDILRDYYSADCYEGYKVTIKGCILFPKNSLYITSASSITFCRKV